MKNRNAFLETFRTKEGKVCFALATVFLIAYILINSFVSGDWPYKRYALILCGFLMFLGCVMFTQYVGAVQNQINKEEQEALKSAKVHKKKK